jgi:hypothetical protein
MPAKPALRADPALERIGERPLVLRTLEQDLTEQVTILIVQLGREPLDFGDERLPILSELCDAVLERAATPHGIGLSRTRPARPVFAACPVSPHAPLGGARPPNETLARHL